MTSLVEREPSVKRFVVLKASGSRFAYVNDTEVGKTIKRYDIFKRYGRFDGWTCAKLHADDLNEQADAKSLGGEA